MLETKEIKSREKAHSIGSLEFGVTDTALPTLEMIESLAIAQEDLLQAAEGYVSADTIELLRTKAALEQRLLREGLEKSARAAAAEKRTIHILNRAFFRLQRINPNLFD